MEFQPERLARGLVIQPKMWIRRILQSQAMVLGSSKSLDTAYASRMIRREGWGENPCGEVPLSKETEDMVVSPSRDIIQIVDHTIMDELKSDAGNELLGDRGGEVLFGGGEGGEGGRLCDRI
ncbi:hypothetical protein Tco_1077642 [Tanacetum coccineum]